MGIRQVFESNSTEIYALSHDGVDVAEVEIFHHPHDGRRFITYSPLPEGTGPCRFGEVEKEDDRPVELLVNDAFFTRGSTKKPAFRRKL